MGWVEWLCAGRIARLRGDAAHVRAATEEDVPLLSPRRSPAVLHLPADGQVEAEYECHCASKPKPTFNRSEHMRTKHAHAPSNSPCPLQSHSPPPTHRGLVSCLRVERECACNRTLAHYLRSSRLPHAGESITPVLYSWNTDLSYGKLTHVAGSDNNMVTAPRNS